MYTNKLILPHNFIDVININPLYDKTRSLTVCAQHVPLELLNFNPVKRYIKWTKTNGVRRNSMSLLTPPISAHFNKSHSAYIYIKDART